MRECRAVKNRNDEKKLVQKMIHRIGNSTRISRHPANREYNEKKKKKNSLENLHVRYHTVTDRSHRYSSYKSNLTIGTSITSEHDPAVVVARRVVFAVVRVSHVVEHLREVVPDGASHVLPQHAEGSNVSCSCKFAVSP